MNHDNNDRSSPRPVCESRPPGDASPTPKASGESPVSRRATSMPAPPARANALKHGLTATTLLPQVLQRGAIDAWRRLLAAEYEPRTPTEDFLVHEMARHASFLDLAAAAEGAVLRQGAVQLGNVLGGAGADGAIDEDLALTAAVSTEAVDRCSRYRRTHEKGFYKARESLEAIRQARTPAETRLPAVARAFASESDCEAWLRRRFEQPDFACPRCRAPNGSWLATRQRWECASCRHQVGLRDGTVMACSRLPLREWFAAIRHVVAAPATSAPRLADALGVGRVATVEEMIRSIRAALESPEAGQQLAGLDRVFAGNAEAVGSSNKTGQTQDAESPFARDADGDGAQGTHPASDSLK